MTAVRTLLTSARIVTLVGPGGVGKTRVALRVASGLARGFRDGTAVVELAEVTDPALTVHAALAALDLRDQVVAPLPLLLSYLADRELLLVVDNCEHVLAGAARMVSEVVRTAPAVKILATSREPLGVPGEHVFPVAPLDLPAPSRAELLSLVRHNDAVSLFVDRARDASGMFDLTEENHLDVVGICRRLDGLPLALELAAVRTRHLGVREILARLDDRFSVLIGTSPAVLPRHRTLRATLDWSYALLSPDDQILFGRLSVFAGRFTLADAEAVCQGSGLPGAQILASLSSLVDKSLVVRDDLAGSSVFRLHETTRAYAVETLQAAGADDQARAAFVDHYVTAVGRDPDEVRLDLPDWLAWAELEIDNLRSVLNGLATTKDQARGLAMTSGLVWYWVVRATTEGERWLDVFLAHEPSAEGLFLRGFLAVLTADSERAVRCLESAAAHLRTRTPGRLLVESLAMAAVGAALSGQVTHGNRLADEAADLARQIDDPHAVLAGLQAAAMCAFARSDLAQFASLSARGEQLSRKIGDLYGLQIWLMNQGFARLLGRSQGADDLLREAFGLASAIDDRLTQFYLAAALGCAAMQSEQPDVAARLFGVADRLARETGATPNPILAPVLEVSSDAARMALGGPVYAAARAAGATLTSTETRGLALGVAVDARRPPDRSPRLIPLSVRETEVARLVTDGLTSRQIASRLFLSERTVENHVRHIMDKLGFTRRSQIAAWTSTHPS